MGQVAHRLEELGSQLRDDLKDNLFKEWNELFRKRELVVGEKGIACPCYPEQMALSHCLACPWLVSTRLQGSTRSIVCQPPVIRD